MKLTVTKRSLLISAFASLIAFAPGNGVAGTLYAIIAADTRDASIGETVKVDVRNIDAELARIVQYTGLELDRRECIFNANWVKTVVNNIPAVGNDDVIIFYYSGHGFRMDSMTTQWPALYVEGTGIELSEIHQTLKGKGAGLLLVMGDCCNSYVRDGSITLLSTNRDAVPQQVVEANYKALFTAAKGDYIASGCSKGQYSFCNSTVGGYFTASWLAQLAAFIYAEATPTWDAIFAKACERNLGSASSRQDPKFEKSPQF